MPTSEGLETLDINILTNEQLSTVEGITDNKRLTTIGPDNKFYFTPYEVDASVTEGSQNPISGDAAFQALSSKVSSNAVTQIIVSSATDDFPEVINGALLIRY